MSASDCVYACRSRHGSLRPTRCRSRAHRQGWVRTRPQSPVQITALGIFALPHSQERHARQPLRACTGTWKIHRARPRPPFRPRSVQPSFCVGCAPQKLLFRSLALASLNLACRNLVPAFPQRSPPSLLTTAACGGLRSTPDCRPRRALLHLSYSCAPPFGPAILVTHDPSRTTGHSQRACSRASGLGRIRMVPPAMSKGISYLCRAIKYVEVCVVAETPRLTIAPAAGLLSKSRN